MNIENICFVIKEMIERQDIPSGVYHIADDKTLSTNELVAIISAEVQIKNRVYNFPKSLIKMIAKMGDLLHLSFNSEKLQKLTDNYIVSNTKLIQALGEPLPVSITDGIILTIRSLNKKS